jgi:hypothetical protein
MEVNVVIDSILSSFFVERNNLRFFHFFPSIGGCVGNHIYPMGLG